MTDIEIIGEIEKSVGKLIMNDSDGLFSKQSNFEIVNRDFVKTLTLYNSDISTIIDLVVQLKKLSRLIIENCTLTSLPYSIGDLTNLRGLRIVNSQLTSIPDSIGNLRKLETLNLKDNQLTTLPGVIGNLTSLEILNLDNNKINQLPKSIFKLGLRFYFNGYESEGIFLANNPIKPPLEIIKQGSAAIFNYFNQLSQKEIKLFETKLIIVGEGGVGKTCLMNKLLRPADPININEISTEGIAVQKCKIANRYTDNFTVNIWDFGGQEIYYATHQFFLTKRSLYLLVWNARKDEDIISFDYWLNVISLLSDNSPIIMVQNKCDERVKAIDEAALKEKFPNIAGFHKVSSFTGHNIESLIQSIKFRVENLPHVGDSLPAVWIKIKKGLLSIAAKRNFIRYEGYIKYCERNGLNREQADFMSRYYHDLGVFLHFHDNDILKDIVFLRPEWATQAVYKVLDTKEIFFNLGRFKSEELNRIWAEYPNEYFIHLIELMKKFELCFKLEDSPYYSVPELLPEVKPQQLKWDDDDNLVFYYIYDFMPAGIITQFIARNHKMIKNNIYWKSGTVLTWHETDALIVSNKLKRSILVRIKGKHKQDMLAAIRKDIDFIHQRLNNPPVKEMVPCSCSVCSGTNTPQLYDFFTLKEALLRKQVNIQCHRSFENILIDKLVGGVVRLSSLYNENTADDGIKQTGDTYNYYYQQKEYNFQPHQDMLNAHQTGGKLKKSAVEKEDVEQEHVPKNKLTGKLSPEEYKHFIKKGYEKLELMKLFISPIPDSIVKLKVENICKLIEKYLEHYEKNPVYRNSSFGQFKKYLKASLKILKYYGITKYQASEKIKALLDKTQTLLEKLLQKDGIQKRKSLNELFIKYGITERQKEVITLLMRGMSRQEIAYELKKSEHTVNDHFKLIYKKCNVSSATGLLQLLME